MSTFELDRLELGGRVAFDLWAETACAGLGIAAPSAELEQVRRWARLEVPAGVL